MLSAQQEKGQESSSKLRPLYLFQATIEDNLATFFISDSSEKIWMKMQPSSDWKEIKIDELEPYRDGERNYTFHGKEFTTLFIPSSTPSYSHALIKLPYIEGKTSSGKNFKENLDEVLLSKQKLDGLGITKFLDLDLAYIPEVSKQQAAAHTGRIQSLKNQVLLKHIKQPKKSDWFDDMLSKGQKSIQARKTPQYKSRLANASIFGEPSAGAASSADFEIESDQKLTENQINTLMLK